MNFQDFLKHVPRFLEVELEASDSHFKMAPFERIEFLKNLTLESKSPKIAAVMMLFYPKDSITHLVLIVRNSYKGVHSAQIAFPGGKFETSDENYEKTALRETHEEIGIHPQSIEVIRAFTHLYIPPSNFIVYPYMGVCKNEVTFIPDSSEVAEIIELPLTVFLNDEIIVNTKISTSYAENISIPAFKINNHMVWGATAMMLSELKDMLKKVL
jgi:8-oxo-dGTP pyrophosphatase MutT (NUDIX family)